MKAQLGSILFMLLFNNVSKGMLNENNEAVKNLLNKNEKFSIDSMESIQLPSEKTIAQHLNTHQFGNLTNESLIKKTLSETFGGNYTSRRAIHHCSENIIKNDPTYNTLSPDAQTALLQEITNQIASLALLSLSSFSSSSSSISWSPSSSSSS